MRGDQRAFSFVNPFTRVLNENYILVRLLLKHRDILSIREFSGFLGSVGTLGGVGSVGFVLWVRGRARRVPSPCLTKYSLRTLQWSLRLYP